ncbi:MAG TPA: hypothetical protein VG842_12385 [Sediminibacterium sp.]|nr:hypothetical protein [Sediminibacterium sp.]
MKSNVMPSIVQMEEGHLKQLVKEVKETIATDVVLPVKAGKNNRFGIVDLWNIQRQAKSATLASRRSL